MDDEAEKKKKGGGTGRGVSQEVNEGDEKIGQCIANKEKLFQLTAEFAVGVRRRRRRHLPLLLEVAIVHDSEDEVEEVEVGDDDGREDVQHRRLVHLL